MFRLNLQLPGQAAGNIGELLVAMRNAKFSEDFVQAAEEWCQEQGAELLEEVAWLDRFFFVECWGGKAFLCWEWKKTFVQFEGARKQSDCWRNCD